MVRRVTRRSEQYQRAAVAYSARLRTVLRARGMTRLALGVAVGVSAEAVGMWSRARYIPRPDIASRVADVLNDGHLEALAKEGRKIRCAMCGRAVWRGVTKRRYCGDECWAKSRAEGIPVGFSVERAAIDAFCMECEPEGFCRTPSCSLQPFSPLPLIQLHRAGVA